MNFIRVAFLLFFAFVSIRCGTPYGVWHKVERGQTLYRISKTYGVPMEKIMKHNPHIKDPTLIIAGDKLFIPGASEVKKIPPPEQPPKEIASTEPIYGTSKIEEFTVEKPKDASISSAEDKKSRETVSPAKRQDARVSNEQSKEAVAPVEKQETKIPKEQPKDFWEKKDLRFVWPVKGQIISSFGEKRGERVHRGIDISAPQGTDIYAAESGQVIFSGKISGYGKVIVIEHPSGFITVYAHNSKNDVNAGDWVKRGDKIGEVGDTGRASVPHLHFEIRVNNTPIDPLKYLPKGG